MSARARKAPAKKAAAKKKTRARSKPRSEYDWYVTVIDIGPVALEDLESIRDKAAEHGHPVIDIDEKKMAIYWQIGDPDFLPDMWELRDVMQEVESDLEGYLGSHAARGSFGKPDKIAYEDLPEGVK